MYRHAHTPKTSADPASDTRQMPSRLAWIDATTPTPVPSPAWQPTGIDPVPEAEAEESAMVDVLALITAVLDATSNPNRMESPA